MLCMAQLARYPIPNLTPPNKFPVQLNATAAELPLFIILMFIQSLNEHKSDTKFKITQLSETEKTLQNNSRHTNII